MSKAKEQMRRAGDFMRESMGADVRADPPAFSIPPPAGGARLQGLVKVKNVAEIPLDRIVRDESQPREEFDPEAMQRLANSMRSRGQLQPVRVRWDEGRGCYVMVAGERRWRAAKLAGIATVAAVLQEGDLGPAERRVIQLMENCIREDLKPVEQARAYRDLIEQNGWTTTRVGEELGISQGSVVKSLKLLEIPEEVQAQVEQGSLSPAAAYEISKLDRPEDQVEVAALVVAGGIPRSDVQQIVKERKAGRGEGSAARRRVQYRYKEDVITVAGPSAAAGREAVLESLRGVIAQIMRDGP